LEGVRGTKKATPHGEGRDEEKLKLGKLRKKDGRR
jgi:hypothetical protein